MKHNNFLEIQPVEGRLIWRLKFLLMHLGTSVRKNPDYIQLVLGRAELVNKPGAHTTQLLSYAISPIKI